jgi:hypothetical protein
MRSFGFLACACAAICLFISTTVCAQDAIFGPATTRPSYACACGCGVFEVGTSSMLPRGQGGMVWTEWDYSNQNHNHRNTSSAPPSENDDKDIRTNFFTLGGQYFFDRSWGAQIEIPVDQRHYTGTDIVTDWTALGDIRMKGIYAGFSEDQSLGIDFGLKLPTGNFTHPGVDRDTQIGTGSTDILLGGFYRNSFSEPSHLNYFVQLETDIPVIFQDHYRPGIEGDLAGGIYYDGFSFHGVKVSPVGQVILSIRSSDGGANSSDPVASGFERVLLSPGIELEFHQFSVYGDVEIPVFQDYRGDQLAAAAIFKVIVSYHF